MMRMKRMKEKKIVTLAITMLLLFSVVMADWPLEAQAAEGGAWVLVGTEYNAGIDTGYEWVSRPPNQLGRVESTDQLRSSYMNISDRQVEWISKGKPRLDRFAPTDMHAIYTWAAPPTTIRPKQAVSIKLTRDVKRNSTGDYNGIYNTVKYGQVGANLYDASFTASDGNTYRSNYFQDGASGTDYYSLNNLAANYTFEWPEGRQSSQLCIQIVFNNPSLYQVRYVYEWKEVSTPAPTPPPAQLQQDAWVLVGTEYNAGIDTGYEWVSRPPSQLGRVESTDQLRSSYMNISDRQVEWISKGKPRLDRFAQTDMHAIYTWDAPPTSIQPKQAVSIKLTRDVKRNSTGDYNGIYNTVKYGQVGANLYDASFTASDGNTYRSNYFQDGASGTDYYSLNNLAANYTFEWPEGRQSSQLCIQIVFNNPSLYQVRYVYEWKEVSTQTPAPTPAPSPSVPRGQFSDLSSSHWAYENITKMVELGILSGYPDGTFKPNNTISRVEFAKVMVMALNLQTARPSTPTFSDVGTGHWAYDVVESARNYLTGYRDTRTGELYFEPNGVAVREDVAVAIVKAMGYGDATANLEHLIKFSDQNKISIALRGHVAIAVEKGYMQGTSIGFEPQKALTRAEACTLLSRIMDREGEREKVAF